LLTMLLELKTKNSFKLKSLRIKKRYYVLDYLHKASRKIDNIALDNKVGTVIIVNIKYIKQNYTNISFVQIPI
ncbi:MAG: transposase, partial [Halanaerobiales bacterium]